MTRISEEMSLSGNRAQESPPGGLPPVARRTWPRLRIGSHGPADRGSKAGRNRLGGEWASLAIVFLPAIALYLGLILVPAAMAIWYSTTNWDGISPTYKFIGFRNYWLALTDPSARQALVVTLVLTVASTCLNVALGMALAVALRNRTRVNVLYRTIIFTPVVISSVVVGFIWRALLGTDGIADTLYAKVAGVHKSLELLAQPHTALAVLVLAVVWQSLGFSTMIYLAGLMTIPPELQEAAQLDGAGPWASFRSVVFPMLAPATTIVVLSSVVGGLQEYDRVVALTNGGPAGGTTTNSFKIIQDAFGSNRLAYGSAEAVILMVIVVTLSIGLTVLLRRREADL